MSLRNESQEGEYRYVGRADVFEGGTLSQFHKRTSERAFLGFTITSVFQSVKQNSLTTFLRTQKEAFLEASLRFPMMAIGIGLKRRFKRFLTALSIPLSDRSESAR